MSSMTSTTTTTLPVELIMEILSYLPAKSLLNSCKLVCTSWRSVIKEADFVKMHLNRGAINGGGRGTSSSSSSSSSNSNGTLMCISGRGLFQFHLPAFNFEHVVPSSFNSSTNDHRPKITSTKLFDSIYLPHSKVVASCNGLVCIGYDEFVLLLNPCTRRYKLSPKEPFQYLGNCLYKCMPTSYGFGCFYDQSTTTTEYKVVRIAHSYPRNKSELTSQSDVKVYSMSTNSWRRVKDIPNDTLEMITKTTHYKSGVFLNGALHWMKFETSDIVSFDMRSEEFRIMPRPPYDGNTDIKDLMIMRGCLGMTRIRKPVGGFLDLEISIMKEYGVSESWTHEFVIRLSTSLVDLNGILLFTVCLDGQILIQEMGGRLVLYDMMKKKICRYFDIHFPKLGVLGGRLDKVVPCIESLVSLKSSELTLSRDKKREELVETLDTEIK